jgi:hypothetical protein
VEHPLWKYADKVTLVSKFLIGNLPETPYTTVLSFQTLTRRNPSSLAAEILDARSGLA